MQLGYALSAEEHGPNELIGFGARAERAGAGFLVATDHFHPWVGTQGSSPFVWSTLGGLAGATESIPVMTGVTCPIIRIHPAIIAQAAATVAVMTGGRFTLGLGAGEALNEHVVGRGWPSNDVRLEMLEEAIEVIRALWSGDELTHRGRHFTVDRARIYTLPDQPPAIAVAAGGERATELAGRSGDALAGLIAEPKVIERFEAAGGEGKPRYGQIHVCHAESDAEARRTALEWWPNTAVPGDLSWEIAEPAHFEALAESTSEEEVAASVVCGPDPEPYLERVRDFAEAGYTHVYMHQIGPDQEPFLDFFERELAGDLEPAAA